MLPRGERMPEPNASSPKSRTRRRAAPGEAQGPAAELPDLATVVGYKLRRAQLLVFQDFTQAFSRLKLRPAEFSVLAMLGRKPGLKQSEVAEALGIKRANFVALMDNLERRGLAERRKGARDKRSHSLHLTPEGQRFASRMAETWAGHETRLVEKLGGAEERDRLIGLLDRIIG